MENKVNWSIHVEFLIVLMSLTIGISAICRKLDKQIEKMDNQQERTDKLYEKYIHLTKERK